MTKELLQLRLAKLERRIKEHTGNRLALLRLLQEKNQVAAILKTLDNVS